MRPSVFLAAFMVGFWSMPARAGLPPDPPDAAVQVKLSVASLRLTDNGDNDGFADPNETVSVFVTLRNSSGSDRQGIVIRMGSSDATVACIPTPVVSFGSLLDGEVREGSVPLVFRVANVARTDLLQDLAVTLDFTVSGDDFDTTNNAQSVTVETDLNVSGGFLPTTYSEGFETGTFGSFTTQSLDAGRESLAGSDGHRCQYNDPDFVNSNSYHRTNCFLGASTPVENAYDWHVHTMTAPDGGRAYLGNNSLHWGVHSGPASEDTTRLRQLDAIRTHNPINLGWNGVSSELTFKHQVALPFYDDGMFTDRGIVQVQLANSAGQAVGNWRKISPYENLYDSQADHRPTLCTFDPTDDGSTENDYFDPTDPNRRLGPSSTCFPEFAFNLQGDTTFSNAFDEDAIGFASDGPGLQGVRGPGTWVESKFRLDRWRGQRLRLRFLVTSIEINNALTWEQSQNWNPISEDDGWYIDDVRVTNTLTSPATVTVDTADRSGLPACGPVCTSVTPSLVVTPDGAACGEAFTVDASGSTADQCPGGALQFRFWWIWGDLFPGQVLNSWNATLLQDWSENAILSHPARTIGAHPYRVDVRCSTLSACGASATAAGVGEPSCPVIALFPSAIRFESKSLLSWEDGVPYVEGVVGSLGGLRSSGGHFDLTTASGFGTPSSHYEDLSPNPGPGQGKYYLVRSGGYWPAPDECTRYSWSTGSPAEVPGVGGDRDHQLWPSPPEGCP